MPLLERQPTQYSQQPSVNPESLSIQETLQPSKELAWMLGVLSGGGYVSTGNERGTVYIESKNELFLASFASAGERLFNINSQTKTSRLSKSGIKYKQVAFYSVKLCRTFGDLRDDKWSSTLQQKHSWLFSSPDYLWSFLEGFIEVRGYIKNKPKNRTLRINSGVIESVVMLSDLLVRVGVKRPKISYDKHAKSGIKGVEVNHIQDLQLIANHIHLNDPDREDKLKYFRQLTQPITRTDVISDEEVIQEWIRLTSLVCSNPSLHKINMLRKQRETKYSTGVYKRRFGEGNFSKAKRALERIVKEREEAKKSQEQRSIGQEGQIFP